MAKPVLTQQDRYKKVVKASLLNPKNLLVLATGFIAGGVFHYALIPIGVLAYGILCYLDLSSEEFVRRVFHLDAEVPDVATAIAQHHTLADQQQAQTLEAQELQDLQTRITAVKEKLQQLYAQADDFMHALFADFSQIENLVEKSDEFLLKAQTIRNYLASENIEHIKQDMTALQKKIQQVRDNFSRRQYQQALNARYQHLEALRDLRQIYERLVSQLTNIVLSLDSMYSRLMKLKTSEYSLTNAESDQASAQLDEILSDMAQLDLALKEHLSLKD